MSFDSKRLTLFIAVSALATSPSFGAQITLDAAADTSLWQRESNRNAGASDLLPAGSTSSDGDTTRSRLLLKFDLAGALPSDAVVQSANLRLTIVRAPSLPAEKPISSSTFTLRRGFQSWGEGAKTYLDPQKPMTSLQNATAGEATWFYRHFGNESQRWLTPGGDLTDGDFAESESGSFFVGTGAGGTYDIPLNATGLQDLGDWLAAPSQNFGWMLKSEAEQSTGTARIFASREYFDPDLRPKLTIVYSLPEPEPPQFESIILNASTVTVRFTARAGLIYRPQYRTVVHSGAWSSLPDLGPLANDGNLEFNENLTGVNERFYRVIIP